MLGLCVESSNHSTFKVRWSSYTHNLLGYTQTNSQYRLFNLATKKMLISRDVRFYETLYYKDALLEPGRVIIPVQDISDEQGSTSVEDMQDTQREPQLSGHPWFKKLPSIRISRWQLQNPQDAS